MPLQLWRGAPTAAAADAAQHLSPGARATLRLAHLASKLHIESLAHPETWAPQGADPGLASAVNAALTALRAMLASTRPAAGAGQQGEDSAQDAEVQVEALQTRLAKLLCEHWARH